MNQTIITAAMPKTLEQVKKLPNHIYAKNHAEAYSKAGEQFNYATGAIVSKKLFKEGSNLVYVFYRTKAKDDRLYVIF